VVAVADYEQEWEGNFLGTLSSGEYESSYGFVGGISNWLTVDDALAHGGSYRKKLYAYYGTPWFTFYGTRFTLKYLQNTDQGAGALYIDGTFITNLDQHSETQTYQQVWSSAELNRGLHYVNVLVDASVNWNLDTIIISNKKAVVPLAVPSVLLDHGALQHLDNDDHPQYFEQVRGDVRYLRSVPQQDHGGLSGLGDDDHSQYHNNTRGDARYLQTVPQQDHGGLSGLGDDDHSQYHNNTRGDARYPLISVTYASEYTPTLYNTANISSSSVVSPFGYLRIGNYVWVWGVVLQDAITTVTVTTLGITLPIASNLANVTDVAGTGTASGEYSGQIQGDVTNDRALLQTGPVGVTNKGWYLMFGYKII
jgi:hypothetical protein